MAVIYDISRLESTFQTDKTNIAINVVGLQLYFKGGNQSPDYCKPILAMVTLCAGEFTVLGGARDSPKPDSTSSTTL